mmetsp:Transcript_4310/g.13822  ORF Transcript_4310/g.13822 Transcript_4310/m.13822 type:complete len:245 (+) Transcript_4310:165-899(+)
MAQERRLPLSIAHAPAAPRASSGVAKVQGRGGPFQVPVAPAPRPPAGMAEGDGPPFSRALAPGVAQAAPRPPCRVAQERGWERGQGGACGRGGRSFAVTPTSRARGGGAEVAQQCHRRVRQSIRMAGHLGREGQEGAWMCGGRSAIPMPGGKHGPPLSGRRDERCRTLALPLPRRITVHKGAPIPQARMPPGRCPSRTTCSMACRPACPACRRRGGHRGAPCGGRARGKKGGAPRRAPPRAANP